MQASLLFKANVKMHDKPGSESQSLQMQVDDSPCRPGSARVARRSDYVSRPNVSNSSLRRARENEPWQIATRANLNLQNPSRLTSTTTPSFLLSNFSRNERQAFSSTLFV